MESSSQIPEQDLINKYLGTEGVIVDHNNKGSVVLKESQAQKRKELVSDIEYTYSLALNHGSNYLGQATINFYVEKLPENDEELFLNSQALAVANLKINDHHITDESGFQNQVIPLRPAHLKLGWNTVSLRYFTPYNNNRVGLHSFIDQQDQKQYLYSQFEAFHCYRVFPCFDQPDLKAKMTLSLTIPQDWVAVSNEIEVRYDQANQQGKRVLERYGVDWFLNFYEDSSKVAAYEFNRTPKISTYLYAICAGPYKCFEDFDPSYIPQRVFVRESLVENLRHELVTGITKTTLDLYQKTFGHRYPFSKVDHVMCPDYKFGAMENVGCITYSDGIMCSTKHMTTPQLTFFCVVIQHELAHMWFGNLITMKWWNDLWLNESFATALSYYACSFGGPFVEEFKDESWLHFANYKRWGLIEDLLPSNHNIEAQCENTDVSESLIDGITYGKGASLLKQLIFLMGWETFSNGLKIYFRKFKWTNTSLHDFISCLQEGYNQSNPDGKLNLETWSDSWLRTKGPNKISYEIEEEDGKIKSFKIRQGFTKNGDSVLRKQSVNIGYFEKDNSFSQIENITIEESEVTDVPQFVGKESPQAILMNSDDYGFAVFALDKKSTQFYEVNLAMVPSQLNRVVVIGQFIMMMREIMYPATRFPKILNQMIDEKNQNLINTAYGALAQAVNAYIPQNRQDKFCKEIADFSLRKAKQEQENPGLQMFCIDKALSFLYDEENVRLAATWLENGKITVDGVDLKTTLTPEHRYSIIKTIYSSFYFTLEQKQALKAKAFEGDTSDKAHQVQQTCEYSLPEAELKQKLWNELIDLESKDSILDSQKKISGFWNRYQQFDLIQPYFEQYYAVLHDIIEKKDREFAQIFMSGLSPAFMARDVDEKHFKELQEKANPEKHFYVQFLKQQLELIETARKARQLCEEDHE